MFVMVTCEVPLLVRVTVCCALCVPTVCTPKFKLGGETVNSGAMPVPLKVTTSGLGSALSVMVIWPVRGPVAVGVNVTVMVQLAPAGYRRTAGVGYGKVSARCDAGDG